MIEIGCSTLGYRFDTLDTALSEIQGQGFRRLDLVMVPSYCPRFDVLGSTQAEQDALQEQLSSMGFVLSTLNTGDGRLGNPANRKLAIDHARGCLKLAQNLGAYAITIPSGIGTSSGCLAGRGAWCGRGYARAGGGGGGSRARPDRGAA